MHDEEHPAGLELTHGEGRGIGLARARGGNEQRAALARTRDPEKILDEGALHRVGLGTHGRNGKRQAPHHLGLGRHVRPALGLVGVDHLMEGTAERMVPERPEFGLKRPCKAPVCFETSLAFHSRFVASAVPVRFELPIRKRQTSPELKM